MPDYRDSYEIGYDVDGYEVDGYDDVGDAALEGLIEGVIERMRRGGGRRRGHGHAPARPTNLKQLAASSGYRLAPMGATSGRTEGDGIRPSNQRRQIIAFSRELSLGAGITFKLTGDVQKAIQVERLTVRAVFATSGNDASSFIEFTDVKVGTRSQLATVGYISQDLFARDGWGINLELDAARTGNDFVLMGQTLAGAPAAINIWASGVGLSAQ